MIMMLRRALPRSLGRRLSSTGGSKFAVNGRSLLGTSVGVSIGTVTFSFIAWPVAEVVGGTYIVGEAMRRGPKFPANSQATTSDVSLMRDVFGSRDACVYVLAGGSQQQRSCLAQAVQDGRPTIHISLREAISPHSLIMALIEHAYVKPFGGLLGDSIQCAGTYWLLLFDFLCTDHVHTRQLTEAVVLSHIRRGVAAARTSAANSGGKPNERPLIIVEHLDVPQECSGWPGGEGLIPMVYALRQFLVAISIDEGRADVLLLASEGTSTAKSGLFAARRHGGRAAVTALAGGASACVMSNAEAVSAWRV